MTGYDDYDAFRCSHKECVENSLAGGGNAYDRRWTRSIAVGGLGFVEKIKERLDWKALGIRVRDVNGGYELREELNTYIAFFDPKKNGIGTESVHFGK